MTRYMENPGFDRDSQAVHLVSRPGHIVAFEHYDYETYILLYSSKGWTYVGKVWKDGKQWMAYSAKSDLQSAFLSPLEAVRHLLR